MGRIGHLGAVTALGAAIACGTTATTGTPTLQGTPDGGSVPQGGAPDGGSVGPAVADGGTATGGASGGSASGGGGGSSAGSGDSGGSSGSGGSSAGSGDSGGSGGSGGSSAGSGDTGGTGGGGAVGSGGANTAGSGASCSQPGPSAVAARDYVVAPVRSDTEYGDASGSGMLFFGTVSPSGGRFFEGVLVNPDGTTRQFLGNSRGMHLFAQPSGFQVLAGSFDGHFIITHIDDDGQGSVRKDYRAFGPTPPIVIPDPRSGLLIVGNFRSSGEPDSAASRRATFVNGDPASTELWTAALAGGGAIFGAGLDGASNALIVFDGSARVGAGAISAQWIGADGRDLTGEFLLLSGFTPGGHTWFETSALADGGVALRRVDSSDAAGDDRSSRYLCIVRTGATACETPPDWLSARRDARIEPIRGGAAYTVLPDRKLDTDCTQMVEVLDAKSGASCGSRELRIAAGNCGTRPLGLGKDGTLIQPLPPQAWPCDSRGCHQAFRWWPAMMR